MSKPKNPIKKEVPVDKSLEDKCARCGHEKRLHAEFIDRTTATMNEAPQRRRCLHHHGDGDRPVYDCDCYLFLEPGTVEVKVVKEKADVKIPDDFDDPMELVDTKKYEEMQNEVKRWRELTMLLPHNFEECNSPPWNQIEDYINELQVKCLQAQKQASIIDEEFASDDRAVKKWREAQEKRASYAERKNREFSFHFGRRPKRRMLSDDETQEAADLFTETRQSILGVDCQECGVCCCPPAESDKEVGDGQAYVELTHADLVRLGSKAKRYMVKKEGRSPNSSGYHLQAYKKEDGRAWCPFFIPRVEQRGEVIKGGCGIYEIRPLACRLWEKGGQGCLQARREHPHTNPYLRSLPYRKKSLGEEF